MCYFGSDATSCYTMSHLQQLSIDGKGQLRSWKCEYWSQMSVFSLLDCNNRYWPYWSPPSLYVNVRHTLSLTCSRITVKTLFIHQ